VRTSAWRVVPDPTPVALPRVADGQHSIHVSLKQRLVFPSSPSVFVYVGSAGAGETAHIWNVVTSQRVAVLPPEVENSYTLILSRDGRHVAGKVMEGKRTRLKLWSVNEQGGATALDLEGSHDNIAMFDFGGNERLYTLTGGTETTELRVWEVATGKLRRRDSLPAPIHSTTPVAPSAGGRFVAFVSREKKLVLYDLFRGEKAGEVALEERPGESVTHCIGMAFSPDGMELAALLVQKTRVILIAWGLTKGEVAVEHTVPIDDLVQGDTLDWLPDRSGWLVRGQTILDRRLGTVRWQAPPEIVQVVRFLDSDHFIAIETHPGGRAVTIR
jgi:hypothetical protein